MAQTAARAWLAAGAGEAADEPGRRDTAMTEGGRQLGSVAGAAGRTCVVIEAGGHGKMGTKQGDYVLAFTLP